LRFDLASWQPIVEDGFEKEIRLHSITIVLLLALTACQSAATVAPQREREYTAFGNPERVTIRGYSDHAMEPFISRDGRYLFFNNSNDPSVNTNLHHAQRINDLTFEYKGEIAGANSKALEGVPTMDKHGVFYFVSTRSYEETLSTIYQGRFAGGAVSDLKVVEGVSEKAPGRVNFDVEVSSDGHTLYFVDGVFSGKPVPDQADIAIAVRGGMGFRRLAESAELLKSINTGALEYAACISSDELELFFTRVGKNGPAIYRAARKKVSQPFDPPERVAGIKGFVEAPALSPDGRSLYYHLKEKKQFAIYRAVRNP
jgi:WD40-like Beta Propeller Repeat